MSDILSWIRLPGPFLVGHRGFPAAARENTPASFEAALEAGCDGVELDARLTRDGVLVVFHDETVPAEAGPIPIAHTDWTDLEALRLESPQGPYRVHRLDSVLEMLSGRCLINLEIKPPQPDRLVRTVEAAHAALDRVRPRESVLVSSFDSSVLEILHRIDSATALGFLFKSLKEFNHLEEEPVVEDLTSLHPRADLVDNKLMKRAAERGLQVHAWTVDDAAEAARLGALGITALITNRPDQSESFLHSDMPPR